MSSSQLSRLNAGTKALSPIVLKSRADYRACHIYLPDEPQRIAAIYFEGNYYSFFRVVQDHQKTLNLCQRLAAKGNQPIITTTHKGNGIWVLEPDARPASPAKRDRPDGQFQGQILELNHPVEIRYVHVPQLNMNMRLATVLVDGKYYSLFKFVKSQQLALELAASLSREGKEVVMTKTEDGIAVWLLEPNANQSLEH